MKRNVFQTDNGADGSDESLPESWSSLNDEKCIDNVRELVNHHVSKESELSVSSNLVPFFLFCKKIIFPNIEERASCLGERVAEQGQVSERTSEQGGQDGGRTDGDRKETKADV